MGIPVERYSKITDKNNREICLLRAFPCAWGKCTFCDYIEDNGHDEAAMISLNKSILDQVTGEFGVLEVINSGSCFELPKQTLDDIENVIKTKNIHKLFFESHWMYRKHLAAMRSRMPVPIIFKIGVETFDNSFRNLVLNKNANFKTVDEVKESFQSVCLLVGIKGQTKEMIKRDINLVLENFKYATINVFINNTTDVKRDEELVQWFTDNFKYLEDYQYIEVLYNNTDFGVGD